MLLGEKIISPFKSSVKKEFEFFNILSSRAKKLLISYTLQGASNPLTGTFINAYIWRSSDNIQSLAYYNIGNFIALPIFFYINGLLLRKIKLKDLYFLGAFISAISVIMVVFFKTFYPATYLLYGMFYGIGFGLYWANRNYLTFKETESNNRNYFVGLNFSIDTVTSIVVPALTGWMLVLGEKYHLYSIGHSYKFMVLVALILLFWSGLLVHNSDISSPSINKIFKLRMSRRWNGIRILTAAIGLSEGMSYFIPTLIILNFLGNEAVLGSFDSIMAIVILLINYLYGRIAKIQHQKPVLWIGLFLGLIASVILFTNQGVASIISFLAFSYIALKLTWLSSDPFVMDVMDSERIDNKTSDYIMIFDRELFLNFGRILSVGIVSILLMTTDKIGVLKSSYLIAYLIELITIGIFWKRISTKNYQ